MRYLVQEKYLKEKSKEDGLPPNYASPTPPIIIPKVVSSEISWASFVHISILAYCYSKFIFTEAFSNSCETWYYDYESAHHYLYIYEFLNKSLGLWKDASSPQAQTNKIL